MISIRCYYLVSFKPASLWFLFPFYISFFFNFFSFFFFCYKQTSTKTYWTLDRFFSFGPKNFFDFKFSICVLLDNMCSFGQKNNLRFHLKNFSVSCVFLPLTVLTVLSRFFTYIVWKKGYFHLSPITVGTFVPSHLFRTYFLSSNLRHLD